MTRSEILLLERERIIANLKNPVERVRWLTALMDVDDELEELQVRFPKKAPVQGYVQQRMDRIRNQEESRKGEV